jgi:hypothetical protein
VELFSIEILPTDGSRLFPSLLPFAFPVIENILRPFSTRYIREDHRLYVLKMSVLW